MATLGTVAPAAMGYGAVVLADNGTGTSTMSPAPTASPSPSASSSDGGGGFSACSLPVIAQGCAAAGAVGSVPGKLVGAATDSAVHAVVQWVADGAVGLLGQASQELDTAAQPQLNTNWFNAHYAMMAQIGASLMSLFLLLALAQGLMRRNVGEMVKSVFVRLPFALFFTVAAGTVTGLALAATDGLSKYVSSTMAQDLSTFVGNVSNALSLDNPIQGLFVLFLCALVIAFGALLIFLELVAREAGIYICLLFVPLVTAAGVWPLAAKWQRRLAWILGVLVTSKFVIIAILSLGAGALAADKSGGGFSSLLAGAVIVLLSAMAPLFMVSVMPAGWIAGSMALSAGRGVSRTIMGRGGSFARAMGGGAGGGGRGELVGGLRLAGASAGGGAAMLGPAGVAVAGAASAAKAGQGAARAGLAPMQAGSAGDGGGGAGGARSPGAGAGGGGPSTPPPPPLAPGGSSGGGSGGKPPPAPTGGGG